MLSVLLSFFRFSRDPFDRAFRSEKDPKNTSKKGSKNMKNRRASLGETLLVDYVSFRFSHPRWALNIKTAKQQKRRTTKKSKKKRPTNKNWQTMFVHRFGVTFCPLLAPCWEVFGSVSYFVWRFAGICLDFAGLGPRIARDSGSANFAINPGSILMVSYFRFCVFCVFLLFVVIHSVGRRAAARWARWRSAPAAWPATPARVSAAPARTPSRRARR